MARPARLSADETAVFTSYMRQRGLRRGRRREQVLSEFLSTERHVTAEELHDSLKRKAAGIGIATVHRCLELFAACGLARKLKVGSGRASYEHDYGHPHHDHLICLDCGKTAEFLDPMIEKLQEKAAEEHGFLVKRHSLEVYGLCEDCRKRGSAS